MCHARRSREPGVELTRSDVRLGASAPVVLRRVVGFKPRSVRGAWTYPASVDTRRGLLGTASKAAGLMSSMWLWRRWRTPPRGVSAPGKGAPKQRTPPTSEPRIVHTHLPRSGFVVTGVEQLSPLNVGCLACTPKAGSRSVPASGAVGPVDALAIAGLVVASKHRALTLATECHMNRRWRTD